jgi:hypothetical protein
MKFFLVVTSLLLPLTATANTLYKCTDDSGVVLYTNQKTAKKTCIVLSQQSPPPSNSNGAKQRSTATPTPGDFPRVSGNEQKARDSDRRAILDKELANELQNAEKAKKVLLDAGNQPAEKLQPLRDTVSLHERNVESLKKEIGNLR